MPRKTFPRGFTLVELAVVVTIVGILAVLAIPTLIRQRPRARLASTTAELQSLVHGARQQALANGNDIWVLVFPLQATTSGTGRVVVYEDANFDFSSVNAPGGTDLDRFNPVSPTVGSQSRVIGMLDLPKGVTFGNDGSVANTLAAPLDGIDLTVACSFCGNLSDKRGGIRFDSRGKASFYGRAGTPTTAKGATLNLTSSPTIKGTRTLIVTPVTGAVRVLNHG